MEIKQGNKAPAFQWYPKDHLCSSRVTLLSLKEEGAYRRAMDYCWLNGSVPSDLDCLRKLIGKGCTRAIAGAVKEMFVEDATNPERLVHERLNDERKKQKERREISVKNGGKGGRPKNPKVISGFLENKPNESTASAISNLHLQSSNIHQKHVTYFLGENGNEDRHNMKTQVGKKLTQLNIDLYNAHLHTVNKVHHDYHEYWTHFRNFINTVPKITQEKNNNENVLVQPKKRFKNEK